MKILKIIFCFLLLNCITIMHGYTTDTFVFSYFNDRNVFENTKNYYIELKQKFQGINAAGIDNFQNFINQIPVAYRANVEAKLLNEFNIDQRMLFLDDFADDALRNDEFWQKMINNSGEAMDNYRNLRIHNVAYAKSFEIITNTTLTNRYIDFYNVPALKNQLEKFDDASRLEFLRSPLSQVTPMPGSGYLNAWLKMKKDGRLANFQTETYLRQFDDFSDELVDKAIHEMTHAERGKGIRQLITESPDDIKNVMKKVLEEPNNAKTFLKETDNVDWKKWGDTQFFKHYTHVGKKFETNIVNKGLKKRIQTAGSDYRKIKDRIQQLTSKNIDEYELFTGLQLNIKGLPNGEYFVADQVFVKFTKIDGEKYISDIIVMESKLTENTKLSLRQGEAFTHKNGGFSGRTKKPKNQYDKKGDYIKPFKNIEIEPTFIKCYDKTDGSEIENLKLITNINS